MPLAVVKFRAVQVGTELSAATGEALQQAVDRARADGHSWREIGDVLGTTRQAAFQRFGHPVVVHTDSVNGAPDNVSPLVGFPAGLAVILLTQLGAVWVARRRSGG